MSSIVQDGTDNKTVSQKRLQSEILVNPTYLENKFNKTELLTLCKAYSVKAKGLYSKKNISDKLKPIILQSENFTDCQVFLGNSNVDLESVPGPSQINMMQTVSVESEKPKKRKSPHTDDIEQMSKTRKSRIQISKGKGKGKKKPKTVKWPCGICGKDASEDSVGCDGCDIWYHADCLKIEQLEDLPDEWYCQECKNQDNVTD